ncbi:hypothetical protein FA15DRAFT_660640 [Coprinopsis marcescibilis]|uniref:Uncharacterized protein n=1 Tax=Coprinopsis marcescibilis TaxID=230819 RepID=A0A5C3KFM8_COPMA|nr:hypothetical protein FA15DRAFT_660640 [Coprinopsis marcescibilis]
MSPNSASSNLALARNALNGYKETHSTSSRCRTSKAASLGISDADRSCTSLSILLRNSAGPFRAQHRSSSNIRGTQGRLGEGFSNDDEKSDFMKRRREERGSRLKKGQTQRAKGEVEVATGSAQPQTRTEPANPTDQRRRTEIQFPHVRRATKPHQNMTSDIHDV